jgi:TetR/AcrR family transcriptional regulator, tetracycline repressor protein
MPDDTQAVSSRAGMRSSLTSREVARAALAMVERDGLDGLSMRRLADGLGVQAASLYWHVQSKDHLLDLMAGELFSALELPAPAPAPGGGWRGGLRDLSAAYYRFLLSHRDAGRMVAGRFVLVGHLTRHLEPFADLLRRSGCADTDIAYGLYAIVIYIQAFVLQQQTPLTGNSAAGAAELDALARIRDGLSHLPRDKFPVTTALAEPLTRPDIERRFFFGLDLLIDGLIGKSSRLTDDSQTNVCNDHGRKQPLPPGR